MLVCWCAGVLVCWCAGVLVCCCCCCTATTQLAWEVPVTERRIAAFLLTAKEHDDYPDDDLPPNSFELGENEFVFNHFHGEPIDPNECFEFNVKLRYMDDPGAYGRQFAETACYCPPPIHRPVSVFPGYLARCA